MDMDGSLVFKADLSRTRRHASLGLIIEPVCQLHQRLLEQGQWLLWLYIVVDYSMEQLLKGVGTDTTNLILKLFPVKAPQANQDKRSTLNHANQKHNHMFLLDRGPLHQGEHERECRADRYNQVPGQDEAQKG